MNDKKRHMQMSDCQFEILKTSLRYLYSELDFKMNESPVLTNQSKRPNKGPSIGLMMAIRHVLYKEQAIPILIKARKLMKEQNLSKWESVDKIVAEEKEKGRINFFRHDGISNNSCYSSDSYHCLQEKKICITHADFRITQEE